MKSQLIDQKPPKKCCGLLSVRLMTSLMCTLLIIITTTSGLAVIFHFSIKATSEIAGRHALGITHKTKVELETSLRAPVNRASGWQYAFTRGTRPLPKDYPQTQNSTWFKDYWHTITAGMRGSRFNYILVSMNFDDGNRVFCRGLIDDLTRKDADELFLCRLLTWKEGYETDKNMSGNELTRTFKRYDYSLVFESIGTSNVDPRRSFIYNWPPRKPGSNRWTNVLLDGRLSVPVIGVCSIIYNETGVLLGVITIGLPLNHIVKLIESIVTTENSVIILIDNEDLLLGSSYYKPHMTINRIFQDI